jgi:PPE family protein
MGFGDWVGDRLSDAGTAIHDAGAGVLGYDTYAEQEAQQRAATATAAGQRERDALEQRNQALQDDVVGYDQPSISQCVNWSGFSHGDIYRTNQDSINEGRVDESAQAWVKLGQALRERGAQFDSQHKGIISAGWEGEAADQAKTLGEPVKAWMEGSGAAFAVTGNNMKTVGSAAGQVKATVPEPEGHSWGRTAVAAIATGPFGGGADALAQMKEREEAEKAAQETMGRVYSPTFTNVDTQMPAFRTPEGRTVDPPPVPPQDTTNWGSGPGPGGGGYPGGGGGYPGGGGGSLPGGGGSGPGGGGPGGSGGYPGGNGGGYPGSGGGGYTPPSSTGSQWSNPSGPGLGGLPPGAGAGTGGGPGLSGGGGMAAGLGVGGVGGAGAGGMTAGGRAGVGGLGAGAGVGAGAGGGVPGAAGARGGAGRGAMGGMGGAGQRGQGGEDQDHERPSWLEEQDDIWMNDMPRTAPPVFGE